VEAYVGRPVYDFLPAEAHEDMRRALVTALETGELQHVLYTIPLPDRPVTIESRIARSTPDEVVVIRQDITDRLRSEREHRYLAALVAQMNESVIVIDPDGIVTLWSPGAERLYGWAAAEAIGRNIGPMILPGTTPQAFAAITAANIALGRSQKTVVRHTKEGHEIVVEASFTALTDADGRPIGLLTVTRDVTANETAHARALDDARLRGLAERMNEIEIVVGPDGVIVSANDRALEAYGYSRDELAGLTIGDLREPDPQSQVTEAAEGGARFPTVHRRKDGSTFPVEVSSRGFMIGGVRYLHSLVRDLTERRRMEADQQRMLDELLAALASVRTLSGLLPICMYCKKIRNDQGYWDRIEKYLSEHSNAELSHGMCPDCYRRYVEPELDGLGRREAVEPPPPEEAP
jgi:PAS domain S-box-containing protein